MSLVSSVSRTTPQHAYGPRHQAALCFSQKGQQTLTPPARFFGGNLKVARDFAKKAARVAHDNFSNRYGD
jgi:hypothetical protein